jgi:hypothetical protein
MSFLEVMIAQILTSEVQNTAQELPGMDSSLGLVGHGKGFPESEKDAEYVACTHFPHP